MSTVSESNPWWAITSAENELGIDSHPFTTASPRAQIFRSVFSLTTLSCSSGEGLRLRELRAAHRPEVTPSADSQVFGLLEVGDRRDVRDRIHQVRLHQAHRVAQLLLDRRQPLVAPRELRHLRLVQVRLEQVDPRRRAAEHLHSPRIRSTTSAMKGSTGRSRPPANACNAISIASCTTRPAHCCRDASCLRM